MGTLHHLPRRTKSEDALFAELVLDLDVRIRQLVDDPQRREQAVAALLKSVMESEKALAASKGLKPEVIEKVIGALRDALALATLGAGAAERGDL